MSAVANLRTIPRSVPTRSDPARFRHAASAMAYPVLDGSITWSEGAASLMRAATRAGATDSLDATALEQFRERVEADFNRALADIERETVAAIRSELAVLIRRRAPRVVIVEAAHGRNYLRGGILPSETVDHIIADEMRRALSVVPGGAR